MSVKNVCQFILLRKIVDFQVNWIISWYGMYDFLIEKSLFFSNHSEARDPLVDQSPVHYPLTECLVLLVPHYANWFNQLLINTNLHGLWLAVDVPRFERIVFMVYKDEGLRGQLKNDLR